MSTLNGGPDLGSIYTNYVTNIIRGTGSYSYPSALSLSNTIRAIRESASLVMPSNAGFNDKIYSVIPSDSTGDFTIVRNTVATYIGPNRRLLVAQPNTPRFEYSSSGEYNGILIESEGRNFYRNSISFDEYWSSGSGVTLTRSIAIAPDNTFSASLLVPTINNNEHPLTYNQTSLPTGMLTGSYAWSIFAKPAGNNFFGFRTNINNTWSLAMWNLQTGTTHSISTNYISHSIEPYADGWYRIGVVAPSSSIQSLQHISSPNGTISFTGSASSGSLIWGAQIERGTVISSYIPSSGSPGVRARDVINSAPFGYATGSYSIFFDVQWINNFSEEGFSWTEISMNPLIWYFRRLYTYGVNFWNQNAQQNFGIFTFTPNTVKRFKSILAFNGSTVSTYINGSIVASQITPTSASAYVNLLTGSYTLQFAGHSNIPNRFYLKSAYVYRTALSDADAISLTAVN